MKDFDKFKYLEQKGNQHWRATKGDEQIKLRATKGNTLLINVI